MSVNGILDLIIPEETPAPELAPLPNTASKRLIDDGLFHYEASIAGFAERYRRGETSHTIHVWWARRPHSAMRALLFASLCCDRSARTFDLIQKLGSSSAPNPFVLEEARRLLRNQYKQAPKVLDMFGGGGTIPFEGALLGTEMHSLDSNELSVFIQRCILQYGYGCNAVERKRILQEAGRRVLDRLAEYTAPLFPKRDKFYTYLWTYSQNCDQCKYDFFLTKRYWVSKKGGKNFAFMRTAGEEEEVLNLVKVPENYEPQSVWGKRVGSVQCPKCRFSLTKISIANSKDRLVAAVGPAGIRGKSVTQEIQDTIPCDAYIREVEQETLSFLNTDLPASRLPRWSGIVNPALYGIETHADFLNPRQRLVLLLLIKSLRVEYEYLRSQVDAEQAKATVGLLSGLIDQLIDWNCRLSMWISQNEQVGRAFCGPGVAMLWDYAETDPVRRGPSNLWAKLERIVAGTEAICALKTKAFVQKGYAQKLPYAENCFDAIVTDPPYYDNIYYNILADFFYSWKRILLAEIEPELFTEIETDFSRELVASSYRSGEAEKAHEDYCQELGKVMAEAERVMKPEGIFALLYSHSSLRGWEALVRAYRPTGLRITSVQPLSIERKQRPRAMTSDAVNTCVVFVAHKANDSKSERSIDSLCLELAEISDSLRTSLEKAGWHLEDIALAAYAQGVGMLVNISAVTGCASDIEALKRFEAVVCERFPSFRVMRRGSL